MFSVSPPSLKWTTASLTLLLAFVSLWPSAPAQSVSTLSVILAWDENPEPDVAGYRVYKRHDSEEFQAYDVQVEGQTWAEVGGLLPGESYWFAVTAYNVFGLESGFSGQLPYTVPFPASPDIDTDHDGLSDWFEAAYGQGGQLDPRSDQDRDNLPAIGEFAHGVEPDVFNSAVPFIKFGVKKFAPLGVPEGNYFFMRFVIDPTVARVVSEADDFDPDDGSPFVLIHPERSFNLQVWQLGCVRPTSAAELSDGESFPLLEVPAGMQEIILRSRNPVSAQGAEFFRLAYEPAAP